MCKRAEAGYRSYLRRLKVIGKLPLGLKTNAYLTWKCLKSLRIEGFTLAEIHRRLGLKTGRLRVHPDRVTRRTALRVQALYRHVMAEGPDAPVG